MTATAFVDGIKKMTSLKPLQAEQLINLAPHMTDGQRADAFAKLQKAHATIEENAKEFDVIMDKVEKKTDEIYKKEWPKVKEEIQTEERSAATAKLDEQIDAA